VATKLTQSPQWQQENRAALAASTVNGSASPLVKPLVDYPDDDDEDAMDTKPEENPEQPAEDQPFNVADVQAEDPSEAAVTPASTTQNPPVPERLAEKRRRAEEDEDELVKLATGPKRRSSTSSNSSAGSIHRKKTLSLGSIGSTEKSTMLGANAAPKRIAINLGPAVKSSAPDDPSCEDAASRETNEKENHRDDSQGEG
jgi:protein phosphatase-4 regulatory subunit 3